MTPSATASLNGTPSWLLSSEQSFKSHAVDDDASREGLDTAGSAKDWRAPASKWPLPPQGRGCALVGGQPDSSRLGGPRQNGHERETKRGGHHVRRVASTLFSTAQVDTEFANLQPGRRNCSSRAAAHTPPARRKVLSGFRP